MSRVTVVGSLNADYVVRTPRAPEAGETLSGTDFSQVAGGKGLNQAVAAHRAGADVTMLGAVGTDEAGTFLLDVMRQDHMKTDLVRTIEGSSGVAVITVEDGGANRIVIVPGANGKLEFEPPLLNGEVVLAQCETPLATTEDVFLAARAMGQITVLNPAPYKAELNSLVPLADWIIPNEFEARDLTGITIETIEDARAAVVKLKALGAKNVIITLGSLGALLSTVDGVELFHPVFSVTAVDTTGAGDAFCGAFASKLATDSELADAFCFAMATGALSVSRFGATPSFPMRSEIDQLVASCSVH